MLLVISSMHKNNGARVQVSLYVDNSGHYRFMSSSGLYTAEIAQHLTSHDQNLESDLMPEDPTEEQLLAFSRR